MRVQPRTEKEIAEANLWPAGVYNFEIIEADEAASKKGNDMIAMRVRLFREDGTTQTVNDYLVDTLSTAYKVRHCAAASGLIVQYEKGELLARDMIGKTGRCKVSVQKDTSGQYPDKNSITDYVKAPEGLAGRVNTAPPPNDLDDEIPF